MEQEFKVLIAEDDEILSNLYEMLLKSEITNTVIKALDGAVAAKSINDHQDISLIISDFDMPSKNGDALYLNYIRSKKIPTLLITGRTKYEIPHFNEFESDSEQNLYLQKPANVTMLLEYLSKYKKDFLKKLQTNKEQSYSNFEKYLRINNFTCIPISMLKKYGNHSIDIYVKLHSDRLTKIVQKENEAPLDLQQLTEYEKKGFIDVFINKDDFLFISNEMMTTISQKTKEKNKISPSELAGLQVNISFVNLQNLGINEDQIAEVTNIIEETVENIFSDKNIESKIKTLMKNYSYHTSHSILCMYIASNIIKKTKFSYEETLRKIAMASFFHDISIDNDTAERELSEIQNNNVEGLSNLQKRLIEHPRQSALIFKKLKDDKFNEVIKIIEEHHEAPNAKGYPRGLDAFQITPLSALFILSHEIANNLYRYNYNREMLELMLKNAEKDYAQGNFKNIFEAAKAAFTQN